MDNDEFEKRMREEMLIALSQLATEAKDAERGLIEMQRFDPAPKTALYFATRVLGPAPGPLSAIEIATRMMEIDYDPAEPEPSPACCTGAAPMPRLI